jgi:DNA-binding response OmpR family regulator
MNLSRPTIVLADDERLITTVVGLRLQQINASVRHARDGYEALRLVEEINPDLVILDIKMPRIDGLAVCKALRTHPDVSTTPVVILTGRSDARTLTAIANLGATYVCKSVDMWDRLQEVARPIVETATRHYGLQLAD